MNETVRMAANESDYLHEDNCTNDYCISDDDYWGLMQSHIMPTHYEWLLISLHAIVFIVGLVGNALVCLAVYRNASMRTVTNFFIVNLAAADFLVILACLPPTVIWDVTETWFLGTTLCKIILYLQEVWCSRHYNPMQSPSLLTVPCSSHPASNPSNPSHPQQPDHPRGPPTAAPPQSQSSWEHSSGHFSPH